jgi:hypothetical protein
VLFTNENVDVAVAAGGRVAVQLDREDRALEWDGWDAVPIKKVEKPE